MLIPLQWYAVAGLGQWLRVEELLQCRLSFARDSPRGHRANLPTRATPHPVQRSSAAAQGELKYFKREPVRLLPHKGTVVAGGSRAQIADTAWGDVAEELRQAPKVRGVEE